MFTEEEIVMLNKKFHNGGIRNKNSLEIAISSAEKNSNRLEQLAYLLKAMLVECVFEDGNKRTAALLIILYYNELELGFDPEKVTKTIIKLAKNKVTDINDIKKEVGNVIR